MRVRVVGVLLIALAALAIAAGAAWWVLRDTRTTYQQALDTLPAATLRAAYTDWAFARTTIETDDLGAFVDAAYDADISRTSALESSATQLVELYGIALRDAEWEIYGQADEGSVAVLRVGDSLSFSSLRDTLRELGYEEPSSDDKAWAGDEALVARLDPTLTPVFENLVLLQDQRLILLSDSAGYAEEAAEATSGSALLPEVSGLSGVTDEPVSAVLWASDLACRALSMSSADATDQARAEELVREAGGVNPLAGLVMARDPAGGVTVGMEFESDGQASANLQPRTDLATGEAPGLGGSFPERFEVTSGSADGRLVVLELEPAPDQEALLSAISEGPILFATC